MSHPERILIVEIRTVNNPGFDSSQLSTIEFFETSDKYQINLNYQQIGSAIIDAIVRLGSNYRHPLLYDIQVLSGDDVDTSNSDKPPARRRRRRRRKTNI